MRSDSERYEFMRVQCIEAFVLGEVFGSIESSWSVLKSFKFLRVRFIEMLVCSIN